jgi:hypothetical protein
MKAKGTLIFPRPDLIVRVSSQEREVKSGGILSHVRVKVENIGKYKAVGTQSNSSRGYWVDIVLTTGNPIVEPAVYSENYKKGCMLKGGRISNTPDLGPGESHTFELKKYLQLPSNTPAGYYCLGAVVDPAKRIGESNENNNTHCFRLKIEKATPTPTAYRFEIQGIDPATVLTHLVRFKIKYYIDPDFPRPCFISIHIPDNTSPNYDFSYSPAGRLPDGVPKGQNNFADDIEVTVVYNGASPYTSRTLEVIIYDEHHRHLKKRIFYWGQTWDASVH